MVSVVLFNPFVKQLRNEIAKEEVTMTGNFYLRLFNLISHMYTWYTLWTYFF